MVYEYCVTRRRTRPGILHIKTRIFFRTAEGQMITFPNSNVNYLYVPEFIQ